MSSTLIAHSPKFQAKLTSYDALAQVPAPMALGPLHKPVPHTVLIDAVRHEAGARNLVISREQFALAANGQALFAVFDFLFESDGQWSKSMGLRNSTDRSMGIAGVAGGHVTVCDNMVLSGQVFAIKRKNTSRLDLGDAMATGFDRFLEQSTALDLTIDRMMARGIGAAAARTYAFEVFEQRIVPARLLDDVSRFYFAPEADITPDCAPRTLWGLHNAFTRAMKDLPPVSQFNATVALGRYFETLS